MSIAYEVTISLYSASLFFLLLIFILYTLYRKILLRHPSQIYYFSVICQIFVAILVIISEIMIQHKEDDDHYSLENKTIYITYVEFFWIVMSYHYISLLNAEIYFKLKNNLSQSYKKRVKMYHMIALVLSAIFTIILMTITEFGNRSTKHINKSEVTKILIYYLCCISMFIIFCIIVFFKQRLVSKSNEIVNLIFISVVHIIICFFMAALVFADDFNISDALRSRFATAIESLQGTSGTIQFFVLMFRTKFRIKVLKLIKKAKVNIKRTFHITELEASYLLEETIQPAPIEPRLYSLTITKGGTFADIFEGLTKNVIKI